MPTAPIIDVLHEEAAEPAPSFAMSIDRFVQNSAQHAVDLRTEQAMMVVLRPSTGAILAVAQNKAADRDGPVATSGQYPPGSIFKIITAVGGDGLRARHARDRAAVSEQHHHR